jgi:hypothetical protein
VDAAIAAIPAGSGEVNTGSNVGAGANVFKTKTGTDFVHRTIVAGTGVVVTENTNTITIEATGVGGGEVNAGANVNVTGIPLYTTKSGVNLQFKGVGAADSTINTASSTAADVLMKVNQAYGMNWTTEQRFTGGTSVPTMTYALHGVDIAGGALNQINSRISRTAPNAVGGQQVQVADLVHVVTGTASTAWEWAQLIVLDNYCTNSATDQVGSYIKAYKRPGATANHWGLAIEVANLSSNFSTSLFGAEIRCDTIGTELGSNSGPLSLFYGAPAMVGGLPYSGPSYMDHALLISPSDGQSLAQLAYGIRIQGRPNIAIVQGVQPGSHTGASMISAQGRYTGPVFDTALNSGATCALRTASGQGVRFSGTETNLKDIVWNVVSDTMEFQYDGNPRFEIPLKASGSQNYAFGIRTAGTAAIVAADVSDGLAALRHPQGYIRIKIDGTNKRFAYYSDT